MDSNPAAHLNVLEPHLEAVFQSIGFTDISRVHVGSEAHQAGHFRRLMAEADRTVDETVARICRWSEEGLPLQTKTVAKNVDSDVPKGTVHSS